MTKVRHWAPRVGLLAGVFAAAMAIGACGGGGGGSEQTAVIAALTYLDNSGFHEIDEELTQDGEVPATAHTTALHIQAVALATDWPSELEAQAKRLAEAMAAYAAAIDTDSPDIAKATELSNSAHATWHDFSGAAWDYVHERAGLKAGRHGHQ